MTVALLTVLVFSVAQPLWKLAVAHPIKNHKFRIGTQVPLTVDAQPAANQIRGGTGTYADFFAKVVVGDIVSVGPNSDGQSENGIISTIADAGGNVLLTFEDNLEHDYVNGDAFRAYGMKMAGGWLRLSNPDDEMLAPQTLRGDIRHRTDDYTQFLRNGPSQNGEQWFYQNIGDMTKFAWHRLGISYRYIATDNSGNVAAYGRVVDHVGGSLLSEELAQVLSWTEYSSSPFFVRGSGVNTPQVRLVMDNRQPNDLSFFWVDDVFLEHAQGTGEVTHMIEGQDLGGGDYLIVFGENEFDVDPGDTIAIDDGTDYAIATVNLGAGGFRNVSYVSGETSVLTSTNARVQKRNNGYVEMDTWHEPSSLRIDPLDMTELSPLGDGSMRLFNPTSDGDRSKRYVLSCVFENVKQKTWDDLQRLMHWQQRGSLINLHTEMDDLPPVMTGKLSIRALSKAFWDFTHHAFELSFEETKI